MKLGSPLGLELGPGDRGYVQGFGDWRWEEGGTWRGMVRRRSRLALPMSVAGPGRFTLEARYRGEEPAPLRVQLDGGSVREIRLSPSRDWQHLSFELPRERVRAAARLRFQAPSPNHALEIRSASWASERPLPSAPLVRAALLLLAGTFVVVLVAGASPFAAVGASLTLAGLVLIGAIRSPAAVHLVLASGPVVLAGLFVVAVARVLPARAGTGVLSLFLLALFLRAALLFHPSFHFYDLPIHETLVELAYHRGLVDFWTRWPEYHLRYGLGLSIVEGERRALLYPVLFHAVVHPFNSTFHAPVLWLKLALALFSSLAVFPVAYLGRRFGSSKHSDLLAVAFYLLVPGLTRSLFLLKFSATLGHLLDLSLVAFLAAVSLSLDRLWRWLAGTLLVAACLVAYNSGFLNVGVLIGTCLVFAPLLGGLTKRAALALASAGLAGLALALLCYHPDAVRNFFAALVSSSHAESSSAGSYSATAMAVDMLGVPLMIAGIGGFVSMAPPATRPLRLLFSAWVVSAVGSLALRFLLPEMLVYHKEHYWAGAALSVAAGAGFAAATRRFRWGALLAAAALGVVLSSWLRELYENGGLFYGPYLFE